MLSKVSARVAQLIRELMDEELVTAAQLIARGIPPETLRRTLAGQHNLYLSTIVDIADVLGCDVVVHFRKRQQTCKRTSADGKSNL